MSFSSPGYIGGGGEGGKDFLISFSSPGQIGGGFQGGRGLENTSPPKLLSFCITFGGHLNHCHIY